MGSSLRTRDSDTYRCFTAWVGNRGRDPPGNCRSSRKQSEHSHNDSVYRKADNHPGKLYYMGHVLMDHREGLAVDVEGTEANGFAEREAALAMLDRHRSQQKHTAAADKAYDS